MGNERRGESGKFGKFNGLEGVAIIEFVSLLKVDVVVADTEIVGLIAVFNDGISNAGRDLNSEEDDDSSIFLSFSMALVSSVSSQGACIS